MLSGSFVYLKYGPALVAATRKEDNEMNAPGCLLRAAGPCPADRGRRRAVVPLRQGDGAWLGPKESILAVTLDSDVYAATRAGFPDLRVFNAQDKEVPYVKLSESQQTVEYKVAGWRAEEDAAGKLTVIHVTTRREPLSEMTLETTEPQLQPVGRGASSGDPRRPHRVD